MKVVNTKQGSREWHSWRGKGLGASDAPAVMGESPWTSPFQLWLEKTGLGARPAPNEYQLAAMRRGNDLEPVARERFEKLQGKPFAPIAGEHDEHAWLRASLDGYNAEENSMLEIKCPSKVDHAKALKGKVPSKYVAQLMQQFLVSGADKCYYVSYDGKESLAVVEVLPDAEYMASLMIESAKFWQCVVDKRPPAISREDAKKLVKSVVDNMAALTLAVNSLKILMEDE